MITSLSLIKLTMAVMRYKFCNIKGFGVLLFPRKNAYYCLLGSLVIAMLSSVPSVLVSGMQSSTGKPLNLLCCTAFDKSTEDHPLVLYYEELIGLAFIQAPNFLSTILYLLALRSVRRMIKNVQVQRRSHLDTPSLAGRYDMDVKNGIALGLVTDVAFWVPSGICDLILRSQKGSPLPYSAGLMTLSLYFLTYPLAGGLWKRERRLQIMKLFRKNRVAVQAISYTQQICEGRKSTASDYFGQHRFPKMQSFPLGAVENSSIARRRSKRHGSVFFSDENAEDLFCTVIEASANSSADSEEPTFVSEFRSPINDSKNDLYDVSHDGPRDQEQIDPSFNTCTACMKKMQQATWNKTPLPPIVKTQRSASLIDSSVSNYSEDGNVHRTPRRLVPLRHTNSLKALNCAKHSSPIDISK